MKRHISVNNLVNRWGYFGRNDAPGADLVMTRWGADVDVA